MRAQPISHFRVGSFQEILKQGTEARRERGSVVHDRVQERVWVALHLLGEDAVHVLVEVCRGFNLQVDADNGQ